MDVPELRRDDQGEYFLESNGERFYNGRIYECAVWSDMDGAKREIERLLGEIAMLTGRAEHAEAENARLRERDRLD